MPTVIKVTPSCIQGGKRGCRGDCPVAIALQLATGNIWLVDTDYIVERRTGWRMPTPESVRSFVYGFDAGNDLEPFEFEIWIYD